MPSRRALLAAAASLLMAISLSFALLRDDSHPALQLHNPPRQVPAERTMEVGMHIKNIYNLSLKDKTFSADGWFWLKWPDKIQELIESKEIALSELVEIVNQVDTYDSSIELDSNRPVDLPGGRHLQLYRFSGKFYDDQQSLRSFPFETLELPFSLELRPSPFSMGSAGIVLKPENNAKALLGDSTDLNGYSISGTRITSAIHHYTTTFGEEGVSEAGDYSMATFEIRYRTNGWSSFYRYLLPWLAVMVILLIAPNLEGHLNDLRLTIPSTALLTLVFLQEGAHAELPALDYLTYLDKLYLFGYVAATAQFCLFVWSTNLSSQGKAGNEQAVTQKINQADLIYQGCTLIGSLTILLLGRLVA